MVLIHDFYLNLADILNKFLLSYSPERWTSVRLNKIFIDSNFLMVLIFINMRNMLLIKFVIMNVVRLSD